MSSADKLAGIRAKIKRAEQHISDLDIAIRLFLETNPYKVEPYPDPQTGNLTYQVVSVADDDPLIKLIVGDVVHALRSALDYVAFQLWREGIYSKGVAEKDVSFPISDDAAKYKTRIDGMVKSSRHDVIEAFRRAEAYQRGNGHRLWVLHRLDNIDKHRLLLTAASGSLRSVNLGGMISRGLKKLMGDNHLPDFDAFFKPADRSCPLKVGDKLLLNVPPDMEVDKYHDFRFEVALNEPKIAECEPIMETIQQLADFVRNIVAAFSAFF